MAALTTGLAAASYASVAGGFLALAAGGALLCVLRSRPDRTWWAATGLVAAALLVLTAVFDSLMIAADLFRFDTDRLLGITIIRAPLEDLAWPLAAALLLPALHHALPRKDRS